MTNKKLYKGNEAFAEAAIRGGLDFFAGYPITPSSEFMEYVSGRLPELNRTFIQAENEISSMYMLFGAGASGKRVMSASSGPGTSLFQEGLSWCASYDIPGVILNVQRYGNGIGTLMSGQADYHRDTRGGGQSDYRTIVISPSTVQEGVDLLYNAFELAERHRMFVILHTEATLGQMTEAVVMPPFKPEHERPDWALNGVPHPLCSPKYNPHLAGCDPYTVAAAERVRYAKIIDEAQQWQNYEVEDADYVIVAYGLSARVCIGVVKRMRQQGIKIGLIRPISLWPYPEKAFHSVNPDVKGFLSVEINDNGQMVDDVALYAKKVFVNRNIPVYVQPWVCGMPTTKGVIDFCKDVMNGNVERRY